MKKKMSSKKNLVFNLCILFLICFQLGAQTKQLQTLESVCKSLAAHQNTTGDFTQIKTLQTNGRKLTSTGKFIFSKEGILWQTEKPFPSSLILTKDAMVQIAANGKKSVMSGKDNQIFANISETLNSVFSGNVDTLKKNFECELVQEPNNSWKILLTPKDSTIASVMKFMVLAGAGADLSSLEMSEMSENTIRYEFKNQKYPEELSADEKQIFIIE